MNLSLHPLPVPLTVYWAFEKEQKALDKAITATVAGLNPTEYQILKSIPGIGPVYAAGILAEIGSVRCFNNNNALAKYSGHHLERQPVR